MLLFILLIVCIKFIRGVCLLAEKDIAQKLLFDYEDVFSDIINVLLFDKDMIQLNEIVPSNTKSQYKADDSKIHDQERDVARYWKKGECIFALFGLENQSIPDRFMPIRVLGYDAASYRSQLLREGDNHSPKSIFPVISVVLNFSNKEWNVSKNLIDCINKNIPEELKPFINDYKIYVFNISFLSDEVVKKFKSDFRYVAEFMTKTRANPEFHPSAKMVKHKDAVIKLLSILTGNPNIEEVFVQNKLVKGEENAMSGVFDDVFERLEAKGEVKGEAKGLISAYTEIGYNKTDIIDKLVSKLSITLEQAETYYENYAKNMK